MFTLKLIFQQDERYLAFSDPGVRLRPRASSEFCGKHAEQVQMPRPGSAAVKGAGSAVSISD